MEQNPYQTPSAAPSLPEQDSAEVYGLATRGERLGGAMLDTLIVLAISFGAGMLIGLFPATIGSRIPERFYDFIGLPVMLLANIVPLATRGQTLGKMMLGTKIVTLADQKPPLWRLLLLRYVPQWIIAFLPAGMSAISLVNALFIFRQDHRCLHDLLAGTKVVKIGRSPDPEVPATGMPPALEDRPMIVAKHLQDILGLKPSEIPLDSRWRDQLRIPGGEYARFCDELAHELQGPSAEDLERCVTYRELLARCEVSHSDMRG